METYMVEGNISVKAVLLANRRTVTRLLVDKKKKDRDTAFILRKAKEKKVAIEYKDREEIDQLANGKTHGGIIAFCTKRSYQSLSEILPKKELFLALIEGVEDPFNFGYILRTLYAAGCDGVIVPLRNWSTAANVVTKASAGASEYIPICISEDMKVTLTQLKEAGVSLVLGQRSDAVSLYDYRFPDRVCIAIGGELRGLSSLIRSYGDQNVFIPYHAEFKNALTAAASTAIFSFELLRQRTKQGK